MLVEGATGTVDTMSDERAVVASPCTVSNLGPGFDVFGMALRQPEDRIEARMTPEPGVVVESISGPGSEAISRDPDQNSAAVAAAVVLERGGADFGLALRITKGVRPFSGIGSSGASAAGGAYAANLLLERPLSMGEMVLAAAKGEEVIAGGLHADNVGPALMGGFVIVRSYDPLDLVRITPPSNLGVVVCMPDVSVSTKRARAVLPGTVPLKDMIFHLGHAASLAVGMRSGDVPLIGKSMRDVVIEPARAPLNPYLAEAEALARERGAAGSFLGGSGPCVIAIFDTDLVDGEGIAEALVQMYESRDTQATSWVTTWGYGCRRLE